MWRRMMRVGFLRRLYAKRLLSYLDKCKAKKRPVPPELREVSVAMSRLPERERRAALEEALAARGPEAVSREYRRAASRQQRQSGRGGPHRRPGAMRTKTPPPQGGGRQNGPRPSRPR